MHDTSSKAARKRGPDFSPSQIESRRLDCRCVGGDCCLRLTERTCRLIECVVRYPTLFIERRIPAIFGLRIRISSSVAASLRRRLVKRRLVIAWVDLIY
jgi:hypothetical protein